MTSGGTSGGLKKNFLGSLPLTIFFGPLINYTVIRRLVSDDSDVVNCQRDNVIMCVCVHTVLSYLLVRFGSTARLHRVFLFISSAEVPPRCYVPIVCVTCMYVKDQPGRRALGSIFVDLRDRCSCSIASFVNHHIAKAPQCLDINKCSPWNLRR